MSIQDTNLLDPEADNKNIFEEIDESGGKIETPFDPDDIDITTKTLTVNNLMFRIENGEINFFTVFQRNPDLWNDVQKSRLIESILLRLPLPAFYFDGMKDDVWDVIDGLQRLTTIDLFAVKKTLKLVDLEFLNEFDGRTFDELPRNLQRRIEETNIVAYVVNRGTANAVKYNLFRRINTGGLILTPQEIRHAINQGIPAQFVQELAEMESFQQATVYSVRSERMQDRDLVTRFVAFYLLGYENYTPDLDQFLNKGMAELDLISNEDRDDVKRAFDDSMKLAYFIFGEFAFRKRYSISENKRNPINKALFDTISVNFAFLNENDKLELKNRSKKFNLHFIKLINDKPDFDIPLDKSFFRAISSGTGEKLNVQVRFKSIKKLIEYTLND